MSEGLELTLCPSCTTTFDLMAATAETVGDAPTVLPLKLAEHLCGDCAESFIALYRASFPTS